MLLNYRMVELLTAVAPQVVLPSTIIFRTFADLRFFFVDLKRWMAIFLLLGSDGTL